MISTVLHLKDTQAEGNRGILVLSFQCDLLAHYVLRTSFMDSNKNFNEC